MNHAERIDESSTVADYSRNGAAVVRQAIGGNWLQRLRQAVDEIMAAPASTASDYRSERGGGRFFSDFFMWRRSESIDRFARCPEIVELAAKFMNADEVFLFYDHLLVKEPGTSQPTPIHQDLPYWPLSGEQIISVWVPLDPVTVDSGAVHYVSGSHRWGTVFAPQAFSNDSTYSQQYAEMDLMPPPDADEIQTKHRSIYWDTQPGDVVLHHPLTLHYAPGNSTASVRRRAIAFRYVGSDARYQDRAGHFLTNPNLASILAQIDLRDGAPLRGAMFPRVWPP